MAEIDMKKIMIAIKNKFSTHLRLIDKWNTTWEKRKEFIESIVENREISDLEKQYVLLYFCFDKADTKIKKYCKDQLNKLYENNINEFLLKEFIKNPGNYIIQNVNNDKSHGRRLLTGISFLMENFYKKYEESLEEDLMEENEIAFINKNLRHLKGSESVIERVSENPTLKTSQKTYLLKQLGAAEKLKSLLVSEGGVLDTDVFREIRETLTEEELFEIPKLKIREYDRPVTYAYIIMNIPPEKREIFKNTYCVKNSSWYDAMHKIFHNKLYDIRVSTAKIRYPFTINELFEIIQNTRHEVFDYIRKYYPEEENLYLALFHNYSLKLVSLAEIWYEKFKRVYTEAELNEVNKNPYIKSSYGFLVAYSCPEKNIRMAKHFLSKIGDGPGFLLGYLLSPDFDKDFFLENVSSRTINSELDTIIKLLKLSGNLNKIPEIIEKINRKEIFERVLKLILPIEGTIGAPYRKIPDLEIQKILFDKIFEFNLNRSTRNIIIFVCTPEILFDQRIYRNYNLDRDTLSLIIGRIRELLDKNRRLRVPDEIQNLLILKMFESDLTVHTANIILSFCDKETILDQSIFEHLFSRPSKYYILIGEKIKSLSEEGAEIPEFVKDNFSSLRMLAKTQEDRDAFRKILDSIS